jgi:hypothetical protein
MLVHDVAQVAYVASAMANSSATGSRRTCTRSKPTCRRRSTGGGRATARGERGELKQVFDPGQQHDHTAALRDKRQQFSRDKWPARRRVLGEVPPLGPPGAIGRLRAHR